MCEDRTGSRGTSTHLSEVTRMVLIHQNAVMVLTTGITTTTRMGTMLSDTTVTGGNVTSLLAVVLEPAGLREGGQLIFQASRPAN